MLSPRGAYNPPVQPARSLHVQSLPLLPAEHSLLSLDASSKQPSHEANASLDIWRSLLRSTATVAYGDEQHEGMLRAEHLIRNGTPPPPQQLLAAVTMSPLVSERFRSTPLQNCLFTPES
jgi:hypothetical protein